MLLLIISVLLFYNFPSNEAYPTFNFNDTDIININLIINKIYLEQKIEKTLIVNKYISSTESCLRDEDIKTLSTNNTVWIYETNKECERKVAQGDIFIIYCQPSIFQSKLLDMLVLCLGSKRDTRILFIWNAEYNSVAGGVEQKDELEQQQRELFEYCARKRLVNVISIYRDYESDGHFYTFSYFPKFQLERKTLDENCYPDRIRDLKGASIRILPDQLEPWSLAWYDQFGRLRIGGYVTKILEEFAYRINGTLTYPIPIKPHDSVDIMLWITLLMNDTIDIVAGTAPASIYDVGHDVPSVLQPIDWNIMLPFQIIPDSELLLYLINSIVGAILLLLLILFSIVFTLESLFRRQRQNVKYSFANSFRFFFWIFINVVFRNVIGLSTCLKIPTPKKFITRSLYVLLFVSGIFMSTLISAALNSYLTSPLRQPRISNFLELSHSGLNVKTSEFEYHILSEYVSSDDLPRLKKIFIPISSLVELRNQHTNLDTRFGYTMLSSNWDVTERYQSYLPQPLFYVSDKMFLAKGLPMSIPIQKHSIFKQALSDMINRIHSSGLTELWTSQAYDDMVAAKILNTTRHVKETRKNIIDLKYLYWLWWLYSIGVCSSIMIFYAELWYYNRMQKRAVKVEQQKQKDDNMDMQLQNSVESPL